MFRSAFMVGLVCAALAGCGEEVESKHEEPEAAQAGPPVPGDTLIAASIGDVSGFIPNITSDAVSHEVGNLIYSGLFKRDRDMNLVGDLAQAWEFTKDCRRLTVHLRKDPKWHDGVPFTAEDVRFTYEAMVNPKTPTAYREDFVAVDAVTVKDPHTLEITYGTVYAKALESWEMWMLPRHLLQRYVQEGKLPDAPQNRAPIGTGPYRFLEWKPGEKVLFTADTGHFAGRPYLSRVVYRVIPSRATIFLELKASGVDLADLTAIQYSRQTDYPAFRSAFNKYRHPGNAYTYFGFNLRDSRFADRRVRYAFAHAINKKELIEGVMTGLAREATGPFKPGTWPFNPEVRSVPYDPVRARMLLAEAGWKDTDGDGIVDRGGKPFTFEILTNQGNDERKKVAELIQSSLTAVGVGADIRVLEWATLIKEYIKKRRFDAIVLGWGIGLDPDQYEIWHSSKTGADDLNHISYANAEADGLLERGRAYCTQDERRPYYQRLHQVLAEDQPVIFLYFRDALPVVAARVRGIELSTNGILYNFPEWYVPRRLQRYAAN